MDKSKIDWIKTRVAEYCNVKPSQIFTSRREPAAGMRGRYLICTFLRQYDYTYREIGIMLNLALDKVSYYIRQYQPQTMDSMFFVQLKKELFERFYSDLKEFQPAEFKPVAVKPHDRIYLAGPVSMYKIDFARETFAAAEKYLSRFSGIIYNPMKIVYTAENWTAAMRELIPYVCRCDVVCVLDGWEQSLGTKLEMTIADNLNIPIYLLNKGELC
jgi:hypothetical protein